MCFGGRFLEHEIINPHVKRRILALGHDAAVFVPVDHPAAGVDVDLSEGEPAFALPEITTGPEKQDDGECEVGFEEAFCVVDFDFRVERPNGDIELLIRGQCGPSHRYADGDFFFFFVWNFTNLSNEDEEDEDEPKPGSPYAKCGLEWELVESMSVEFPCGSESDMSKTDLHGVVVSAILVHTRYWT